MERCNKKIIIINSILPKELSRLYCLVDQKEAKQFNQKINKFYNSKKEAINDLKDNLDYCKFLFNMQQKYPDKIFVVNQEVDDHFQKSGVKCLNVHGSIFKKNKELDIPDITLRYKNGQYNKVIEIIEKTHMVIFVGKMGQLDPNLFLNEMTHSVYINEEDEMFNNQNVSTDFDIFINKNHNDSIEDLKIIIQDFFDNEIIINKESPYKDNGLEIIEGIENFINGSVLGKYGISKESFNSDLITNLHNSFPFTKKINSVYLDSIWQLFCSETKRKDDDFTYDHFFYDMLLVYSLYRWSDLRKILEKKPKISLTNAYNNNNEKEINIFKKLISKSMNSIELDKKE